MDNDRLYIPYGLTTEPEQFSGFGKKEVRHCVAGIAFFGVVAALIYLFTANLTAVMATAIIGIAASIMMTRRDGTSHLSMITHIINMINFNRGQKTYRYVYKSKWN